MSFHQTACHECDLLIDVPEVQEGHRADCPRCGCLITGRPRQGEERALAFAIAGIIFLIISLLFPFLSLSSSGVESVMNLPDAVLTIYEEDDPLLAGIIFIAVIGAPALLLASIFILTLPMVLNKKSPWLPKLGKFVFTLSDWNVVEVFMIGVIVSLVKIAKLASVVVGLSFWAYVVFTVCLVAALSGLDRYRAWQKIEALSA